MSLVRPVAQLANGQPQQVGRIKVGIKGQAKNGKTIPRSIDTFRFTSADRGSIDRLSDLYGGTVTQDGRMWDVVTEAAEIDVVLPPDPFGGTPIYELWGGGGCERRCDGEVCTVPRRQGDDVFFDEVPCVCVAEDSMACKPTTRLSVILPQVRLGGVWMLKTNSWAAAQELQQMVAIIEMAQTRGLVAAKLGVTKRETMTAGRKRNFVVPVLILDATLADLAEGRGLATTAQTALPGVTAGELVSGIVDATPGQREALRGLWGDLGSEQKAETARWMDQNHIDADRMSTEDAERVIAFLSTVEIDDDDPERPF